MIFIVRDANGDEVCHYVENQPTEVNGFDLVNYTHEPHEEDAPVVTVDPLRWRIYVGSFFDRFGAAKIGILADQDPAVQAVIKDATVRRYIDLIERRDELLQVIGLLNAKGHEVDPVAVLDVEPNSDEVWRGE